MIRTETAAADSRAAPHVASEGRARSGTNPCSTSRAVGDPTADIATEAATGCAPDVWAGHMTATERTSPNVTATDMATTPAAEVATSTATSNMTTAAAVSATSMTTAASGPRRGWHRRDSTHGHKNQQLAECCPDHDTTLLKSARVLRDNLRHPSLMRSDIFKTRN